EPRYPASGRLQQELARAHEALGDQRSALSAYRRAVQRNDALADSWTALARLARASGALPEAEAAARCALRLSQLPPPVAMASSLLNEGELGASEQVVRQYLQQHGAHIDAIRVLAQVSIKLNVLDDAEILLENILLMRPDYTDARFEYAWVLAERRTYEAALPQILQLLRQDARNPIYRKLHALICDGLGRADEALQIYREVSQEFPQDAEVLVSIAHILKTRGATDEAVRLFEAARAAPETFAAASLALANTRGYRFEDGELARMRRAETTPGAALADRYHLYFALGKV